MTGWWLPVIRQPGPIRLSILPATPGWTTIIASGVPEYRYTINTVEKQHKQGCKPLSGGFNVQLIEQVQFIQHSYLLWTLSSASESTTIVAQGENACLR